MSEEKMRGFVYVLTNEAMPGLVKIGRTDNTDVKALRQRVQILYNTGVPLPFDIYHAVLSESPAEAEGLLHDAFKESRLNPKREFFSAHPERVVSAMKLLEVGGSAADLGDGGVENNEGVPEESRVTEQDICARDQARKKNRPHFKFERWGVPIGSVLRFARDHAKTAKVVSDVEVELNGKRMRLGRAAAEFLPSGYARVAGAGYWEYEDPKHGWELLSERRNRMEEEEREENDADSEE